MIYENNAIVFYVDRYGGRYRIFDETQSPITTGNGDARFPQVAVDPTNSNNFLLVWEDNRAGHWEVFFTKQEDGSKESEQELFGPDQVSRHPDAVPRRVI